MSQDPLSCCACPFSKPLKKMEYLDSFYLYNYFVCSLMMSNVDYISGFCISPSWWGPLCLAVSSELPHSAIASFPVWFSSFSSGAPVFDDPSDLKQPSYILPPIVEYFLPPDGLTASHSSIVKKKNLHCRVGDGFDAQFARSHVSYADKYVSALQPGLDFGSCYSLSTQWECIH